MISFIVIGKNEGWRLNKCFDSIHNVIKNNGITDSEIIYVDSKSTDDSIKCAKNYANVKVFLITGECNAAIARNIGAKEAKGDVLFLLDGDMELLPGIYQYIFNYNGVMKYPFIRGRHHHIHYNGNFEYLYTIDEPLNESPVFSNVTGGLMIIKKELWASVNGMDERLIRNQDIDLGLRLSKRGFQVLLVNQYFVNHYTISYYEKRRFLYFIKTKALLSPGILLRKHIFNLKYLKIYYRDLLYVYLLLSSILVLFFDSMWFITMFLIYILIQVLRVIKSIKKEPYILQSFIFKFLRYFYILIGFFYFPNKGKYSVKSIT